MTRLIDALDQSHILKTLRLILDGQNATTVNDLQLLQDMPDTDKSETSEELIAVECGRASLAEVPQIEACKQLWDWCGEESVAQFLYNNHVVDVLYLVLANAQASVRYMEVAVGALAAVVSSLGDQAAALHSPKMRELFLENLLPSPDPFLLSETLHFLSVVVLCPTHQQDWLETIHQTYYATGPSLSVELDETTLVGNGGEPKEAAQISAVEYLGFILQNTLVEEVRENALTLLLHIMYYHKPSLLELARADLAMHLQELWPVLARSSSTREATLDICELLLSVPTSRSVAEAILTQAEAEDNSTQWE